MAPIEPQAAERAADQALIEVSARASEALLFRMRTVLANLTREERERFSQGNTQPIRLAKIILCACQDEIGNQFASEATLRDIRSVSRLRKARYC